MHSTKGGCQASRVPTSVMGRGEARMERRCVLAAADPGSAACRREHRLHSGGLSHLSIIPHRYPCTACVVCLVGVRVPPFCRPSLAYLGKWLEQEWDKSRHIYDRSWESLSDVQREAASVLGYNKEKWNRLSSPLQLMTVPLSQPCPCYISLHAPFGPLSTYLLRLF